MKNIYFIILSFVCIQSWASEGDPSHKPAALARIKAALKAIKRATPPPAKVTVAAHAPEQDYLAKVKAILAPLDLSGKILFPVKVEYDTDAVNKIAQMSVIGLPLVLGRNEHDQVEYRYMNREEGLAYISAARALSIDGPLTEIDPEKLVDALRKLNLIQGGHFLLPEILNLTYNAQPLHKIDGRIEYSALKQEIRELKRLHKYIDKYSPGPKPDGSYYPVMVRSFVGRCYALAYNLIDENSLKNKKVEGITLTVHHFIGWANKIIKQYNLRQLYINLEANIDLMDLLDGSTASGAGSASAGGPVASAPEGPAARPAAPSAAGVPPPAPTET